MTVKTTIWYRDPHVLGAIAACVLGILLTYLPAQYHAGLQQVYALLVTLGIISARADVSSTLTFTKGDSSNG